MIALASATAFTLLGLVRGRACGDRLCTAAGLLTLACAGVSAAIAIVVARSTPPIAVGLACLVICAWTDVAARRVYLPVSGLALATVFALRAVAGAWPAALAGGAAIGGSALALLLLVRGRGFAGGDVLLFTLVGLSFGARDGLWIAALALVGGALIVGGLVLARVFPRDFPIPLAVFVLAGALAEVSLGARGALR